MKFCLMNSSEDGSLSLLPSQSLENTFGKENSEFISNFFSAQDGSYKQWEKKRKELKLLSKCECQSTNPIALTDQQLERWIKTKDKNGYLSVGPYQVNLMLLHAIMVPMAQWSDNYTWHLSELAKWLLHSGDDDETLRAFTQPYPGHLLANILFLSLIRLNIDLKTITEVISDPIYEGSGADYSWVENSFFIEALTLPNEQFTSQHKIKVINLLKGYFDVMMPPKEGQDELRAIPKEQLDDTQKEIIYQELKQQLPENLELQCSSRLFLQQQQNNPDNKDSRTLMRPT